jgi:UDP-N-acetylmuramoyl-tripeptide--D-alanyl-D-alanine ligase
MRLTAADVATAAGGELVAGDPATVFAMFTNDTRALESFESVEPGTSPEACFVALRDRRDGHDFLDAAFAAGAVGAVVSRVPDALMHAHGRAIVRVDDPARALMAIATEARARLEGLQVVAITGSTGKTSTKDLAAAAIGAGRVVHANPESFNNEIGLPLTVLGADPLTEVLVTEMGARFKGNIAELCAIARPSIGVVTNIGLAHAEHLGGPEGVLAVKGELLEALPRTGLAVVDGDDPVTPRLVARSRAPVLRCGSGPGVDVRLTRCELDDQLRASIVARTPWGPVATKLGVRGQHQATNALFAIAVAGWLGVAPEVIAAGLAAATGSRWRLELERRADGLAVLNDVYNANPTSMAAALRALAALTATGRKIAVLGEMRELGEHSRDAHAAVGELAGRLGIDVVVGVGAGGAEINASATAVPTRLDTADAAEALVAVRSLVGSGDVVLLKGSRAVGLELVAHGLLAPDQLGAGTAGSHV